MLNIKTDNTVLNDKNNQKQKEINIQKNNINSNEEYKKEEKDPVKINIGCNLSPLTLNDNSNNNALEIYPEISENIKQIKDLNDYYSSLEYKNIESNTISINDIIGPDIEKELTLDIMNEKFDNFFQGKVSTKSYGYINAYAANTNQGISRDYNEDRVSIIININKPSNYEGEWPRVSFFSVYDGHGGNKCAEFLRQNLMKLICFNEYFPNDIEKAIKYGFEKVDSLFLENCVKDGEVIDSSGSCALILLLVDNKIYVANVGDSRCLISMKNGLVRKDVTRDHKPNYPYEKKRIISNGGKLYQTKTPLNNNIDNESSLNNDKTIENLILLGPYRVFPGSLSVSRTIGDPFAKLANLGGNPKVVISEPDIYCFDLEKDDVDFLILGCDGIFDHLSSRDVFKCAWMMIDSYTNYNSQTEKEDKNANKIDINITCAHIVDFILKAAMTRKSFDNVSCVIVSFKDLLLEHQNKNNYLQNKINGIKDEIFINYLTEYNGKLPKIINYSNINLDNDLNKPTLIQKKIYEEKIQNKSLEKEEDKNGYQISESNLSRKIEDNFNQNISPKKFKNRLNIFNEFKNKTLDNNIKKLSLSTKRTKNYENITFNNNNNYLTNNQKEISEYNLLKYSNNNRNESKGKKNRFNTVKKFNCGKIKPKIINNDKNKFLKNLQLKIINNNKSSFRKYSGDDPLSNGKDKFTFPNNNVHTSPRVTTVNTDNSRQLNNKYKINLNYILSPKNKSNNCGLELKYMNKKSNSFYVNNIMNSLKLKVDSNLYKPNITKISQFDMMNFNSNNEMNLDNNIKKEKESIIKFRVSSEDKIKSYNDKAMINQNCNILNNTVNSNNQRFAINKNIEKKLITNLKEDLSSRKNRFIFPTLNIKNNQNESTKKSN